MNREIIFRGKRVDNGNGTWQDGAIEKKYTLQLILRIIGREKVLSVGHILINNKNNKKQS